jgi:hypothetical protein
VVVQPGLRRVDLSADLTFEQSFRRQFFALMDWLMSVEQRFAFEFSSADMAYALLFGTGTKLCGGD